LEDVDGHRYIDFMSDYTSGLYGKSNPILKEAITKALDDGLQLGALTTKEAEMAALIKQRFPSIDLLRFTNSGTEANIMAISTAIRYTQRKRVVVFEGAYHGGVLGGFKRSAPGHSRTPETNTLQVPFVSAPTVNADPSNSRSRQDFLVLPYNDKETAQAEIHLHANEIAAVLVEPMLGSGGCFPGDPDFLRLLRQLTTEHQIVLICDEVQTARLAYGGRQGLLKIDPDMTTAGKFLGGGFAFGVFGGKKEIMNMFDNRRAGSIGHGGALIKSEVANGSLKRKGTFNNSPLTMAAGTAALKHILTPEVLERVNSLGNYMRDSLNNVIKVCSARSFRLTDL
jgi:glutamate-1-semialdehyde 2,1-aminomutase